MSKELRTRWQEFYQKEIAPHAPALIQRNTNHCFKLPISSLLKNIFIDINSPWIMCPHREKYSHTWKLGCQLPQSPWFVLFRCQYDQFYRVIYVTSAAFRLRLHCSTLVQKGEDRILEWSRQRLDRNKTSQLRVSLRFAPTPSHLESCVSHYKIPWPQRRS